MSVDLLVGLAPLKVLLTAVDIKPGCVVVFGLYRTDNDSVEGTSVQMLSTNVFYGFTHTHTQFVN